MIQSPKVIFEDDSLFIFYKPAGWITDEANTTKDRPVLQSWIAKNFEFEINDFEHRNGLVHRLDKETSGILIVAKTKKSYLSLQEQFKNRQVSKTYIALVHGEVKKDFGEIQDSVGRLPWRRERFGVLSGGKEAITYFKKLSIHKHPISNEKLTLIQLQPKTGRTHQLRIHLKHIGHPIVADEFYAGRKTARSDREWCPRLFLHATKIKFSHPITAVSQEFESPLPSDLTAILKEK